MATAVPRSSVSEIVPRIVLRASEREPTDVDSAAPTEDPAWQPSLRDKLRLYRHGSIPGWFDRIDGTPLASGSIGKVRYKVDQANLRRRMACDLAFHTASVTTLIAICVDTAAIAQPLRHRFDSLWSLGLVLVALLVQLVLLKLVLDVVWLRVFTFGIYSLTLSVFLALVQFAWESPHDMVACSICLTVALLVYCWLSGLQYRGVFLSFSTLWTVVVVVAGAGVGIASTVPHTFTPQGATLLAICALLAATYGFVYETLEFLHSLTPQEAPLALYLVHIDMAAVLFYVLRIVVVITAGLVVGVVSCALEPFLSVVKWSLVMWRDRHVWVSSWRGKWLGAAKPRTSQIVIDFPRPEVEQAAAVAVGDTQILR